MGDRREKKGEVGVLEGYTGKNNRFLFLDILGYLKSTHKNPTFGKGEKSPNQGIPNQDP